MAARTFGLGASLFLVSNAEYVGPGAHCNTPCVSWTMTVADQTPPQTACTTSWWRICRIHKTSAEDPRCPAAGSDPNWPTAPALCYTMGSDSIMTYKMPKPAGTQCQANTLAYNLPSAETGSCGATIACCPVTDAAQHCEGLIRQFGDECKWQVTTPPKGCGCGANAPEPPKPISPSETCSTPCMDLTVTPKAGTDLIRGCGITSWEICRKYRFSDSVPGCPDRGNAAWPAIECVTAAPGFTNSYAFYAPHGKCSGSIPGRFLTTLQNPNQDKCRAHATCCSLATDRAVYGCSGVAKQVGDFCEWDVTFPSGDCGCPDFLPGKFPHWPSASCQSPCLDITVSRIEGEACPTFWNVCLRYKYSDEVPGCPVRTDPKFQPQTQCWEAPVGQKFPIEIHSGIGGCSRDPLAASGGPTVSLTTGSRVCSVTTSCCAASESKPTCNLNAQENGEWCRWEVDIPDAACSCKTESTSSTTPSVTTPATATASTTLPTRSSTSTVESGGGHDSQPANVKKASLNPFFAVSAQAVPTSMLSAPPSCTLAAFFAVSLAASGAVAAAWRRGGRGARAQAGEDAPFVAAQPSGEE